MEEIIKLENIAVGQQAASWKEALVCAGSRLVEAGSIEPEYIEQMIAAVEKLGPYIVLMPGFALGHSEPCAAVHRDDLSLITLKEPVCFNSHNDPVSVVMCLACASKETHLQALQKLALKLMEEGIVEKMAQCQSSEELYQLINQ